MPNIQLDIDLALAAWYAEQETTRQKSVVLARKYYAGDHDAQLSERQKEFLYPDKKGEDRFSLNYCKTIVDAVVERLLVAGFESVGGEDAPAGGKAAADPLAQWASDVWAENRMDGQQAVTHMGAVRDGEAFIFIEWDEDQERTAWLPHPRYTDPLNGGEGFGCKAFYPNGDTSQPMEKASKRWSERYRDGDRNRQRVRMNAYYPDRVERFVLDTENNEAGWSHFEDDGEPWLLPWVTKDVPPGAYDQDGDWIPNPEAKPLGIPIIHFHSPELRSELWNAIVPQNLINKTALDIIASADSAGFPIRVIKGGMPTKDGLPPESDGSNYISLFPGAWIEVPTDGDLTVLQPADMGPLLETLDSWIVKLAQITDTPTSRFQITRQIAAEGTLKQQEAPLLAKVRARSVLFGNAWEDCLSMTARLARFYNQDVAEGTLSTLWEPAETRDDKAFREAMKLEMEMGVPREMLWAKLGYTQDQIDKMKAMSAEEMQTASNIGGELLKAFEGGGGTGAEQQAQGRTPEG